LTGNSGSESDLSLKSQSSGYSFDRNRAETPNDDSGEFSQSSDNTGRHGPSILLCSDGSSEDLLDALTQHVLDDGDGHDFTNTFGLFQPRESNINFLGWKNLDA
jgi:hypothetical protein